MYHVVMEEEGKCFAAKLEVTVHSGTIIHLFEVAMVIVFSLG